MKNIIFKRAIPVLVILGLFFTLSAIASPPTQGEEKRAAPIFISMDFQDAKLKNVLKILSQQSGLNFIASEAVKTKRVTLYLDNVSVQDALDSIINANGLSYEQAPGSDIFIVKEPTPALVETITRVFRLDYAPVSSVEQESKEAESEEYYPGGTQETEESEEATEGDIVSLIRQMLTREVTESETGQTTTQYLGSIAIDARTNSIIVTDTPAKLKIIEETIVKLDVPMPQVMIEVEVIETKLDTLKDVGILWGTKGQVFSVDFAGPASLNLPYKYHLGSWRGDEVPSGELGTDDLKAILKMLVTEGRATILARPKLLVLNNETAEINITTNMVMQVKKIPYYDTDGHLTHYDWDPERSDAVGRKNDPGISLKVTPVINRDGMVTMKIEPAVRNITTSEITEGLTEEVGRYYDLDERATTTTVMVNDGETVILGGLISKKRREIIRKVPFFGDIPILGNLFRHKEIDNEDTELVFFITPHVINKGAVFSRSFSDQSGLSGPASGGGGELENAPDLPQSPSESGETEKGGNAKLEKLTRDIKKELEIQQAIEKFSLK